MVRDPYSGSQGTLSMCGYMQADTSYGWDGRLWSYTVGGNPVVGEPNVSVAVEPDGMQRPVTATGSSMTVNGWNWTAKVFARNAQYDIAGRLASYETLQFIYPGGGPQYDKYTVRTMGYNVNGQLASEGWSAASGDPYGGGLTGTVTYSYGAGANNGQISQAVDSVSGETVSYAYDALKRLVSASSNPTVGSVPAGWTQTYQYDGFGTLTGRVLNGVSTAIAADAATNRLVNAGYDAAGNMVSGMGGSFAYDGGNRLVSATAVSGGTEYYGYAPDGKRIYTVRADGTEEWTLFGGRGEELGTFARSGITGAYVTLQSVPVWFAGRIVGRVTPYSNGLGQAFPDRLGTERVAGARRKPYGEDAVAGVKFATYSKDGFSGLMYADQRFYASGYGRFTSADPYMASGGPREPQSWNRYAYVQGDPANLFDPTGQMAIMTQNCNGADCVETGYIYCGDDEAWDPGCAAYGYQDPAEWCSYHPYDASCSGTPVGTSGVGGSGGSGVGSPTGSNFNPPAVAGAGRLGTILVGGNSVGILVCLADPPCAALLVGTAVVVSTAIWMATRNPAAPIPPTPLPPPQAPSQERCRAVKAQCIDQCSDTALPTTDNAISFQRCMNQCMAAQGCLGVLNGPGRRGQ